MPSTNHTINYNSTDGYYPNDGEDNSGQSTESENNTQILPITQKDLDALKNEINNNAKSTYATKQDLADVQFPAPFDSYTGVLSYSTTWITLLLLIGIFVLAFKLQKKGTADEIAKLNKDLSDKANTISNLQSRLSALEQRLNQEKDVDIDKKIQMALDKYIPRAGKQAFVYEQTPAPKQSIQPQPPPPPPPPPPSLLDKCHDFIQDFNNCRAHITPGDFRQLREDFINKYRIKGFECTNYNERQNNPSLPPEFKSTDKPINSEYWAYEVEAGNFAVVPNVKLKSYNENYHVARAMGTVFNSNFSGGNYNDIRVVKPAFFKDRWILDDAGELVLS